MQFTVGLVHGTISFQAVDTADGEKFEIKNMQLKDGVLPATQRMPSTNWTTHAEHRSTGKDTLEERSTGAGQAPCSGSANPERIHHPWLNPVSSQH